ncbi:MAG: hypothetical protein U0941_22130 [Planctomycetaceae bacterium]
MKSSNRSKVATRLRKTSKDYEQEIAASEAEVAKFIAGVRAGTGLKRAQAAELEAKLADVEKILPADIVPQYRRLVQSYGARALAPVHGTACGECYVGRQQRTIVELRAGKFCVLHLRSADVSASFRVIGCSADFRRPGEPAGESVPAFFDPC